ncbi:MAG: ATP-grasp domain-containing protein [Fuscovulum sp.]|jgi:carbamoyl-phosphate synthase large subunit|nr:MAG: ATP-grasp domain-containing protein [Fuscovulum sp.]
MTTVLVTGTGAVIGYGILRCLQGIMQIRTVASDIYVHAAGQHFADVFHQAPLTRDPSYPDWLSNLIKKEGIDLVIPGIEQDVAWLASVAGTPKEPPTLLSLNRPEFVRLCMDKIAFDKFLADSGDPVRIPSSLEMSYSRLVADLGTPFLLKPRDGYAGKGIIRVHSKAEFLPHADEVGKKYLAQRIIGDESQEYTVSAFCVQGEIRAVIALRRLLSPEGATAWAETTSVDPFLPSMKRISEKLGAEGPTNFQYRICEGMPMLLEINPRISSATSIRAAFGFNEAAMCVDHYLHGRAIHQPELRNGTAVRYLTEFVAH